MTDIDEKRAIALKAATELAKAYVNAGQHVSEEAVINTTKRFMRYLTTGN
jgi:hypothetical protein